MLQGHKSEMDKYRPVQQDIYVKCYNDSNASFYLFSCVFVTCVFQFKLLSIVTPRYLILSC